MKNLCLSINQILKNGHIKLGEKRFYVAFLECFWGYPLIEFIDVYNCISAHMAFGGITKHTINH